MGYRPPPTVRKLDFSGTEHEGLEVATRGIPLGVLLDITEKAIAGEAGGSRDFHALFAGSLESWNVEDSFGDPVPATLEGLLSLDATFATEIFMAWAASMATPPAKKED